MTFSCRKNTLMMALVYHKMYLVVQLPLMKRYFRRKKWIAYKQLLWSKMSVSDDLVGIIVLPTRLLPTDVGGLLPLATTNLRQFFVLLQRTLTVANSFFFFFCTGLLKESPSILFIPNQQLCFVLFCLYYLICLNRNQCIDFNGWMISISDVRCFEPYSILHNGTTARNKWISTYAGFEVRVEQVLWYVSLSCYPCQCVWYSIKG